MTDRIPLPDLTSDQYDELCGRLDQAEKALSRVRAECDRIEAAVHSNPQSPDFDGAYLAALGHIRAALDEPGPAATQATDGICSGTAPETEPNNPAAVAALYEQWVKAGPPPLGTSLARWWDRRLVELRNALNTEKEN